MQFKLALLAAAAALSFGAQATTTDWGTHDPLEVAAAITPIGTFTDDHLFNLAGVLGISNGTVSLFRNPAL